MNLVAHLPCQTNPMASCNDWTPAMLRDQTNPMVVCNDWPPASPRDETNPMVVCNDWPPASPRDETNPMVVCNDWPPASPRDETNPMVVCSDWPPRCPETKRTQWVSRHDGSRKRARPPAKRFPQTNPLARYDVLSTEKCRYPGDMGSPRTKPIGSVRPFPQTNPMVVCNDSDPATPRDQTNGHDHRNARPTP